MKKPVILLLALALWSFCANAQPTFMKMFRGAGTARVNLFELASGNLFTGMAVQSGTSLMDTDGNIIRSVHYAIDTFLVLQTVRKNTDNEFYFGGGYYKDTCTAPGFGLITRIHPVIGRMDSLGEVLDVHSYELNSARCSNAVGYLEMASNGDVIAWGRDARLFAMRTTSTGEVVWAKSFDRPGGFQFIKELPGGDLLVGLNVFEAGASVARMDADGNLLWCKSYLRPQGMIHDAVIESDDSFIVTGYTDSTNVTLFEPLPEDFHPKLFMMKLNGVGEVQWCKGYQGAPNPWYTQEPTRIERTHDGNYAILATLGQQNLNLHYRPYWMKVDQNADTLWTRSTGASDYIYYAKDLLVTADGGILFNGQVWGDLPEGQSGFAFLYKADAEGHLPCEELYSPIIVMDLFPTDSSFTLTSTDGAELRPAFISNATYPPIIQYDGCLTTSIPHLGLAKKPRIYPNPTPGRFTVEFQDPLVKDSYYSVYDVMGKLLFQRAAAHGKKTEEVDLTGYGKGTYVIRFTDGDGVCYERVVVE